MSITRKLFTAIALTIAIIVAFMAVMIAVSMRSGFSQYLLQAELDRFDELALALSEAHDPDHPGWPEFATPRDWHDFSRRHIGTGADGQSPGPSGGRGPPGRTVGARPPPDPLQLGARLTLLDAEERVVAGPDQSVGNARRPIQTIDASGSAHTVGWIALSAPEDGPVTADSVFLVGQFRTLILASLLAVALSAAAAFLLARQFLAPVCDLVDGAQVLAGGDYSSRMANTRRLRHA